MCHQCEGGISGHADNSVNVAKQGHCHRCSIAIYPGMECGIENGNLVCLNQAREKKLPIFRYGECILAMLYNVTEDMPEVA